MALTEQGERHVDRPKADLRLIHDLEDQFLRAALLRAAVEVELFRHLGVEARSAADIAAAAGCDRRAAVTILDALATLGLVAKRDAGYASTPTAETFLLPGAPSYYGRSLVEITLSLETAGRLAETIRTGEGFSPEAGADVGSLWASDAAPALATWHDRAPEYQALWRQILDIPGTGARRCLDMACGGGVKTFALAQIDSGVVVRAVDLYPEVLEVAGRVAEAMNVIDRVEFRTADVRSDDLGDREFDIVFVSSVLYFFEPRVVRGFYERAFRALKPGGVFVSDHLVADEKRETAHEALLRAVQLLAFHTGSHVPTLSEYRTVLGGVGFVDIAQHSPSWVSATKPGAR